jgi:hypothetical protein
MALATIKHHGERAPVYAAEQIGRLALEGDQAGVEFWKKVCRELDGMGRKQ